MKKNNLPIQEIIDSYKSKETITSIAAKYNTHPKLITTILKDNGLQIVNHRNTPKETAELIVKEYKEGGEIVDLAFKYNVSYQVALMILNRNKIYIRKPVLFRELKPELKSSIISNYSEFGVNASDLSDKYDLSVDMIRKILKEGGVVGKNYRKYPLNEDYFTEIDTSEKAIFLGLALTDGCVHKDLRNFTIKLTDKDILEKFTLLIQPEKKITVFKPNGDNHNPQFCLAIASYKVCADLIKWGIPPQKTFITEWPSHLRKDLIRPFLQGCWEGDGSFSGQVNLTGAESFILKVQEYLLNELQIECAIYTRHPERNNNIRTLTIRYRRDNKKFCDWLYKDSPIYMERKFQEAQRWMNYIPFPQALRNEDGTLFTAEQRAEKARQRAREQRERQRLNKSTSQNNTNSCPIRPPD